MLNRRLKTVFIDADTQCFGANLEAPRTSRNEFHAWLEKTIEETAETKDNNPETIEVRVFKNE